MGIGWFLKFIFVFCICILKAYGFSFDLLGHTMTEHLGMPRSIPTHLQNLSSLLSWSCRDAILVTRS